MVKMFLGKGFTIEHFFKTNMQDIKIKVKKMQLVTATNHCMTNSTLNAEIGTDTGTIDPRESNHHVISAPGNSSGDSFCLCRLIHLGPFP